jgi:predicted Zn-dependent protease
LYERAMTLRELNRNDEAIADFERLFQHDPDDEQALGFFGDVLRRSNRWKEAVEVLGRALRLDPNDKWDLAWRGEAKRMRGDLAGALSDQRAVRLDPEFVWGRSALGAVLAELMQLLAAKSELEWVVEREPEDTWSRCYLAKVCLDLDDTTRALEESARALDGEPQPWMFLTHAEACLRLGDLARARADVQAALKVDPTDLHSAYMHALVSHAEGSPEHARSAALAALEATKSKWFADRRIYDEILLTACFALCGQLEQVERLVVNLATDHLRCVHLPRIVTDLTQQALITKCKSVKELADHLRTRVLVAGEGADLTIDPIEGIA